MADPSFAVQKALYTALNGNITINGSPGRNVPVYDAVPQNAAYPYVTFDSEITNDADFLNSRMDERFFYLTVWSTYRGQKEVKEIMAEIDRLLHRQRLTLDTGTMVHCTVRRKRSTRDADAVTFMGQITLRIITQH